jgi:hypothetical protein
LPIRRPERSPETVIFHFLEISILFLTGLQEELQNFESLKENSKSTLIVRKSVNMKFFQVTAEFQGKRNISRVF